MLKALCKYYDCLRERGDSDLVPDGYSNVPVNFNLVLRADGAIREILPYTQERAAGKTTKTVSRTERFPFRNSVSGIAAETIDHREKYLFGLEWDKAAQCLAAGKSSLLAFEKCRQVNLEFLDAVHTPLAEAYKAFLRSWQPQQQTENAALCGMGKEYAGAKFVITLEGQETAPLNRQKEVTTRWEEVRSAAPAGEGPRGQCGICGGSLPIARTHDPIRGIYNGLSTGTSLVCFNNTAFESYTKKQSYNSSICVACMKKYTAALNYLAASQLHSQVLGDITLLFWANTRQDEAPYLNTFLYGAFPTPELDDDALKAVFEKAAQGLTAQTDGLDLSTEFYILGVKPNSSRLSVKLFERSSFGKIVRNLAKHCSDMRFSADSRPLSLKEIDRALLSPNVKENGDPALQAKLLLAVIRGAPYPQTMLNELVRRCKTDHDRTDKKNPGKNFYSVSTTRARILRGCLRRKNYFQEDEYTMLQENSTDTAYTLGRLFAVLEKTQTEALGNVNATIKDKFFSSACTTPGLVFPRLLKLAQPHLAKLKEGSRIHKEKLIQELLGKMEGAFPKTLGMEQQGMFILGYYQQKQKLYEKTEKGE